VTSAKSGQRGKKPADRSGKKMFHVEQYSSHKIHRINFTDDFEDFDYENDVREVLRDLGVSEYGG
jgi:hypothetical protein